MNIHFFGNLAAILLITEAICVFLILLVVLIYAIRGMRWLRVNVPRPLKIAQEKTSQAAAMSKRVADTVAAPVIGSAVVSAGVRQAVRESVSTLKRRKQ